MKFSIKNFFSKCDQIKFPADLVTFTKDVLDEKLHFLCNVSVATAISDTSNFMKFYERLELYYDSQILFFRPSIFLVDQS